MRNGFYLPEYKLTPQAIFQNEILAFDVNFFNPKENKKTQGETKTKEVVNKDAIVQGAKSVEEYIANLDNDIKENANYFKATEKYLTQGAKKVDSEEYTPWSGIFEIVETEEVFGEWLFDYNNQLSMYMNGLLQMYNDPNSQCMDKNEKAELTELINKIKDIFVVIDGNQVLSAMPKTELPKKTITYTEEKEERSSARELQSVVSAWYTTFRNIALVALLSVLVYIGIRITLSSVASDKAKYKQMLGDWVVALCLVFLMHYIMSFAVTINSKIIDAISSITTSSIGSDEDVIGNGEREYDEETNSVEDGEDIQDVSDKKGIGVQLFVIEDKTAVDRAYKTLVGDEDNADKKSGKYSTYYKNFSKDKSKLFWMTTDYMAQARMLGQDRGEDNTSESQTAVNRAGYNIIYVVLVIYTVIFCFTYLKRVIYMAFLTIIAPLVAITYPIDKISDGKAQAFDMWLKEYIFNLLIQPMHLILYTILVGSAMRFASQNIFYVVVALGFLLPAEKLLRRFFGFEKAQTPGMFAGPAASALMMTGLRKLMPPKSPKGGLGPGGSNSKDGEDEETKTPPWRDKEFDATDNLIGIGGSKDEKSESNIKTESGYDKNLTQDQIDELEQEGIKPGDAEYNSYLRNHGINPNDSKKLMQSTETEGNSSINNMYSNPNLGESNIIGIQAPRYNSKKSIQPKKKISRRKAIKNGMQSYGDLLKKRYKANKAQKGGFIKRGIRMAGGVAAAGTLAAAGGIIGITSGDPSKAAQYMAAGAAGGYSLGTKAVDGADNSRKRAKESIDTFKEGYYGDEYSKKQQEKYKKEFRKNDENVAKIAKKLNVERSEAREIMKNDMGYYIDKEIYNIDDMIATYKLEQEIGRDQAVATAQYATQVMNGEDTRYMTSKKKNEYRNTFIPKFAQKGSKNPEADVDKVFDNVDKFYKFKK